MAYEAHGDRPGRAGLWLARALGALLLIVGAALAVGGAWLALVGGSAYYVLAGVGLILSGWLLLRGRVWGAWLYAAVFAATAVWAVWEVGWRGWPLVPRLVGPAVLMVLALAVVPALTRNRGQRRAAL